MEVRTEPVTVRVAGTTVSDVETENLMGLLKGLKVESYALVDEIRRIEAEEKARTRPLYDRLKEVIAQKEKIEALSKKPACFGTRNDLDLPDCELCGVGALCYKAMKAKGLI